MSHVLAQTRLDTLFDNRRAATGGFLGMVACGLLATLMVHAGMAGPSDDSLDELPFMPGMVMALGSMDAEAITTPTEASTTPSEPTDESPAEEPSEPEPTESTEPDTPEDAVTEDVTPPKPRPPRPTRRTDAGGKLPGPPKPTPPAPPSRGNPFGDPKGFDEMSRDGDPWARGVIAALEAMKVGTAYAKPITGNVRFQMVICKDGRVSRVQSKGGSASIDERDLVILEVGRIKIPRPPAKIAAQMKSNCVKLKHTFSWTAKGTK